jgi:hypothetical protein
MFRTTLRTAALTGLVIAAAAPAVATAAPAAAAPSQAKVVKNYTVSVKPGIVAGNAVQAKVVVRNPESSVSDWWSKATISKVVRKGVNGKYEMPYTAQGYRCTPVVKGNTASFTCKLRGADVSTTVKLTFDARFKG